MTLKLVFAIALGFLSEAASSETIKFDTPACKSEASLDEAFTYLNKKDASGLTQLMEAGECTLIGVGDSVSVISKGWKLAEIRYERKKLFVPKEAVQ